MHCHLFFFILPLTFCIIKLIFACFNASTKWLINVKLRIICKNVKKKIKIKSGQGK